MFNLSAGSSELVCLVGSETAAIIEIGGVMCRYETKHKYFEQAQYN